MPHLEFHLLWVLSSVLVNQCVRPLEKWSITKTYHCWLTPSTTLLSTIFVCFVFFVMNPWLDPISKISSLFSHLLLHLIDSWICWWLTEITCFFFRLCGLDELILHEGLCGHCAGHCLTALSFWTYSIFLTLSLGDAKVTIAVRVRVRWCSTSLFLSLLPPPLLNPTQTPPQQKSRKQNCKAVPNQLTRLTDCKIGW